MLLNSGTGFHIADVIIGSSGENGHRGDRSFWLQSDFAWGSTTTGELTLRHNFGLGKLWRISGYA